MGVPIPLPARLQVREFALINQGEVFHGQIVLLG